MTPNHDHTTLFVAASAPSAGQIAGGPESIVDSGAAAMRRLRHPFSVQAEQTASAATEAVHPV